MAFRPHPPVDSRSPSERLVHAVAEQTNTDPVELPPLYDTIDPDALDALLSTLEGGKIEFQYAGHAVRLESDGVVHLTDETESDGGVRMTDDVVPNARRVE